MSVAPANSPVATAQRIEELGRIIMAYSEVTDRLQQSHDQLQQTVESLRGELSEKNRLLERRNRLAALGEMAAGMAHEIRNPLGGIQLYASLLAKDVAERAESLQLVTKISAGVKRLESLVSQVLHFTREITASVTEADLSEVVAEAVELAENAMLARDIVCTVNGPRSLPVQIDPILIGQALLNLLLNAADATPTGGSVSVTFAPPAPESGARQFHLVVRDSGPGISTAILDKVFNPFFTTKDNGTGLGLAIVHRIVEAHEGTISVTNPPDGGARFEIRV
ncbi:MAG TPA: ATP-binding protein [Tepidisphaeraceae bacterium]|nr:ATP-binding protein [Tepidisphaeraceae bacterium]